MGSILFAVIFIQHGSTFSVFLPDGREIAFQRCICCLICYFKCAGSYGFVGSGIIQPIIAATNCIQNLIAWC